jgi:hypothetical protein
MHFMQQQQQQQPQQPINLVNNMANLNLNNQTLPSAPPLQNTFPTLMQQQQQQQLIGIS